VLLHSILIIDHAWYWRNKRYNSRYRVWRSKAFSTPWRLAYCSRDFERRSAVFLRLLSCHPVDPWQPWKSQKNTKINIFSYLVNNIDLTIIHDYFRDNFLISAFLFFYFTVLSFCYLPPFIYILLTITAIAFSNYFIL